MHLSKMEGAGNTEDSKLKGLLKETTQMEGFFCLSYIKQEIDKNIKFQARLFQE